MLVCWSLFVSLLLLSSDPASAVPLSSCPGNVSSNTQYELTQDLSVNLSSQTASCIRVVNASNVTIDFRGFKILTRSSNPSDTTSSGVAISCSNSSGLSITDSVGNGGIEQSESPGQDGWNVTAIDLNDCANYAVGHASNRIELHSTRSHRGNGSVLSIGRNSIGEIWNLDIRQSQNPFLWNGTDAPGRAVYYYSGLGNNSHVINDVNIDCVASEDDTPTCIESVGHGLVITGLNANNPHGGCLAVRVIRDTQSLSAQNSTCNGDALLTYHNHSGVVEDLVGGELVVTNSSTTFVNTWMTTGVQSDSPGVVFNNLKICREVSGGHCVNDPSAFANGQLQARSAIKVFNAEIFAGHGWGGWYSAVQFRGVGPGSVIENVHIKSAATRAFYAYQSPVNDGWLFDKVVFESVSCNPLVPPEPGVPAHPDFCPDIQYTIHVRTCGGQTQRCVFRNSVALGGDPADVRLSSIWGMPDGSASFVFDNFGFSGSGVLLMQYIRNTYLRTGLVIVMDPLFPFVGTFNNMVRVPDGILRIGTGDVLEERFTCQEEIATTSGCSGSGQCPTVTRPCTSSPSSF